VFLDDALGYGWCKWQNNAGVDDVNNLPGTLLIPHFFFHSSINVTSGVGTAYPSGAPAFTPGFKWSSCYSIFSFICMFCRSLFVLLFFFRLAIVLSVFLRYMDSDYLPLVSLNSAMLVLALQNFARVVSLSLLNKLHSRYLRSSS
jgi:hypothetical protein